MKRSGTRNMWIFFTWPNAGFVGETNRGPIYVLENKNVSRVKYPYILKTI